MFRYPIFHKVMSVYKRIFYRSAFCIIALCITVISNAQDAVVHIHDGYVKGREEESSFVFKGIPYAAAPLGVLRFKAPQLPARWSDTLDCTAFSVVAPQAGHPASDGNCLSLNIYSGDLHPVKLYPVVVWIHGGGMTGGSGKDMNGHAFSDNDSIVAVTINYRLGAFGFLELNDLGKDYAASGNNGVLDCMAALRWIKNNIRRFGGDPRRVTIMGESAGAKLVSAILATPLSDGLVRQAIMESGSVQCIHDTATALAIRSRLFSELHITKPEEILSIPTEAIIHAQEKVLSGAQGTNYFGPVIDGIVYKENPYEYILHDRRKRTNILIGTNKSEAKLFMDFDKRLYHPTEKSLTGWFGDNGAIVYNAFLKAIAGRSDTSAVAIPLLTQYMYQMHAYRLATALSLAGNPTWMYRFDYGKQPYGALHGDELRYIWHIPGQGNKIDTVLAKQIHHDWVSFIKGKNLSREGWPRYDSRNPTVRVYNGSTMIEHLSDVYDDKKFPSSVFVLKK